MQTYKLNISSVGNPTHAGFVSELFDGPLCRTETTAKTFRTDDRVTCKTCIAILESERFSPLVSFSPTELAIYEARKDI